MKNIQNKDGNSKLPIIISLNYNVKTLEIYKQQWPIETAFKLIRIENDGK
ncbi:MAG: hypothetical protein LBC89_00180 [Bacteroidales bacterium]|nr:hypothetical protein [Bacteroidales bacterium]